MFATITAFAKNAVTKYKAKRVRDVVDSYIAVADGQLTMTFPVVLEGYRRVGHIIVDKTFENPAPAIALIEAMDQVSKHYGPALLAEFKAINTALENAGASAVVTSRLKRLMDSVDALGTDTQ